MPEALSLLPHLKGQVPLKSITNQTALSARHVKEKFGFETTHTDYQEVIRQVSHDDAVLIGTRHHLHAPMVLDCLRKKATVFVEKPLCLTVDELVAIDSAVADSKSTVQVGFNRRFAPVSTSLKRYIDLTPGPKSASIRVMAGVLAPDHWYANYAESGGRIIGEACHFFDYLGFLFGSRPIRVMAQPVGVTSGRLPFPDSIAAQVEYSDGSSGQVIYSSEGDSSHPKEAMTVYGAGIVAEVINFQSLDVYRGRKKTSEKSPSKGHREQMEAWVQYLRGDKPHPLPYEEARVSMLVTFAVLASIRRGASVDIDLLDPLKLH